MFNCGIQVYRDSTFYIDDVGIIGIAAADKIFHGSYCLNRYNALLEKRRGKGQREVKYGSGMFPILVDVFDRAREADQDDFLDSRLQIGLNFVVDFSRTITWREHFH